MLRVAEAELGLTSTTMKITSLITILVAAMVEGKEGKYRIVQSSPAMMVKEGSKTLLGCKSSQPWFFCLWRPPVGEKECSLQEGGGVRKVCRQGREELEVAGGDSYCSLTVPKVTLADHGDFLCLLNQAETFLTARSTVRVEVATEAKIRVRVGKKEKDKVEAVEGEVVELECEARRAHPPPTLTWVGPGGAIEDAVVEEVGKDEGHTSKVVSRLTYRASASDSSSMIQCISSQVDPASSALLFSKESNITLAISQAAPLLSPSLSLPGRVGLITAILLAIALVLLTLFLVLVFIVKKKKKRVSSSTPLPSPPSSKAWKVNPIWMTRESRTTVDKMAENKLTTQLSHPHTPDAEEEDLHCTVEVHNSSASSSSTSTSCNGSSSSSSSTSYEANRSLGDIVAGNFVSFSPTSMYHQEKVDTTPYKPQGIGSFDPSMDVHAVTRPSTASLNVLNARPKSSPLPTPIISPLLIPHPSSSTMRQHSTEDMLLTPHSDGARSLFHCPHGCFSPHHSSPSCDHRRSSSPTTLPSPLPIFNATSSPSHPPPAPRLYSSYAEDTDF